MRIAVCEFRHESNSFNPQVAGFDLFDGSRTKEGQAFLESVQGTRSAPGAFLDELEREGQRPRMLLSMRSLSSGGHISDAVVSRFLERNSPLLAQTLPLDGLLVSLHGASVSESEEDVCGLILETLRAQVGPGCIISASFDLHANITDRIQRNADFICGYQTYPHVDLYETGSRAARLLLDSLLGRIHARTYRTTIPMIVPAGAYTNLRGFFGELLGRAHGMVREGRILDFSIFQAQPWLDVHEIGASIVTIGEDEGQAKACAMDLAQSLFENREAFRQRLYSMDEVIVKA